jgi:pyruvate formate lyase activating enzyme
LMQPGFALAILQGSKDAGLHTAVETTTQARWKQIEAAVPFVDLFMVDIKQLDPARHQQATGVSNQRILANIRRLATTGKAIIFRIPVVPGVNDTERDVQAIAGFVRELGLSRADGGAHLSLELLPFHQLAADKYASLGMPYRGAEIQAPGREKMAALAAAASAAGVAAHIR